MDVNNVKSQMRKGMLEYCIMLLLHKEPAYASDIILPNIFHRRARITQDMLIILRMNIPPVSYTHLDVYKRQVYMFIQFTFHSITPPEAPFCNCAAILSPFVLTGRRRK